MELADTLERSGCCSSVNSNLRTLLITFTLFTTITSAQVAGAILANSMALGMDCVSMGIDSLTYVGNIYAECRPHSGTKKRDRLIASFVSVSVLIVITGTVIKEALDIILDGGDGEDDDVNAWIVFGFALAGLLFDMVSLLSYFCSKEDPDMDDAARADSKLNMASALLHVGSDSLRSMTTLVEAILLWTTNYNGTFIDAWASLIVSGLILLGALGTFVAWVKEVVNYCKFGEDATGLDSDALLDDDALAKF